MQNTLKHKYMSRWEIVLNMKINEGKWEKKKKKLSFCITGVTI